ncbi:PEP-CTERM sorting domain-containing protein [Crocosphaera sp. UHCC 0190]|uniref:PEP-CTERM sorting domain-containing protein n=1 Tax=Crocosphaera sp. UHCC 0190 TaxID=3110246 RepID=UPI003A52374B
MNTSKLLQKLAIAGAISAISGVGLAISPAQAGVFSLTPQLPNNSTNPGVRDTESGSPGELIWTTFPGFPTGAGEGSQHGVNGVNGYDNPTITYDPLPGVSSWFKIEFFGKGTSSQNNQLFWNGQELFAGLNCPNPNSFDSPCASTMVQALDNVPFEFRTNLPPMTMVANGDEPTIGGDGNVVGAHYFATLDGTWATTTGTDMVYIGFSDGNGGGGTSDDDAADFVIKITSIKHVPEPGTVLGLLALGGLGLVSKRKKQK